MTLCLCLEEAFTVMLRREGETIVLNSKQFNPDFRKWKCSVVFPFK